MRGFHDLRQLPHQTDRLRRLHRRLTPLELVRQQHAFEILHRQVGLARRARPRRRPGRYWDGAAPPPRGPRGRSGGGTPRPRRPRGMGFSGPRPAPGVCPSPGRRLPCPRGRSAGRSRIVARRSCPRPAPRTWARSGPNQNVKCRRRLGCSRPSRRRRRAPSHTGGSDGTGRIALQDTEGSLAIGVGALDADRHGPASQVSSRAETNDEFQSI